MQFKKGLISKPQQGEFEQVFKKYDEDNMKTLNHQ